MSASEEQSNVMDNIQRRRVELMERETDGNINIGSARRQVTALESLFPRVSVQSTEEENGNIIAYIINVRSITAGPIGIFTEDFAKMKARAYTKIKIPTKSIADIRLISSQEITLPILETPTGRTFNTFRVEVE